MIDHPDALPEVLAEAAAAPALALDTEFVWERTYWPALGVVQLGWGEGETRLLDAAALDLAPLGRLLAAPEQTLILHDAEQDLTILRRATGAAPRAVFDTRLAAGFVGLPATLSLGDLLRETVGVDLPKTQSRTDWLRRPLSEKQLRYARDDVRYLPAARAELLRRVEARGRRAWLDEEMAGLEDPALYAAPEPREQYRRFKAHARMAPRELAVLREVTAWREEEARRRDRPRGHIVPDGVLLALAKRQPAAAAELGGIQDLSRRAAGRYGEDLLAAVARGLALPEAACPPSPPSLGRRDPRKALADAWLEELRAAAAAAGIDASLLATRRNVTDLVLAGPDADPAAHPLLRGWRRELIGRDLREDL